MVTVLLATDGSEYADAAAERAVELARERDATLHVLCVVDRRKYDEPALSTEELATISAEDHGHECVARAERMAEAAAIEVECTCCHGIPHEVILEYAEEIDADVIVVGAHGEHTDHFGGVGRAVADRAECEVLVVEAARP